MLVPVFIVIVLFWIFGGPEYGGWPNWAPKVIIGGIILALFLGIVNLPGLAFLVIFLLFLFITIYLNC